MYAAWFVGLAIWGFRLMVLYHIRALPQQPCRTWVKLDGFLPGGDRDRETARCADGARQGFSVPLLQAIGELRPQIFLQIKFARYDRHAFCLMHDAA